MKRIGTIASMLVLAGSLAGSAMAADGILVKEEAGVNYCHMKFSAMDENTLSSDQPRLKPSTAGDFIDFYGPCDESPTGKDQVEEQRQQESNKWSTDYEG